MTGTLVSTEWLAANLGHPDIAIVDASWYMPGAPGNAHAEFLDAHIPGAVHFDIDVIADHNSELPHTLADEAAFAAAVGELGISDDQTIVVYDSSGLFSAPRVWWNFRVMGAQKVRILNGGFTKWRLEGLPVEKGAVKKAPRTFVPRLDTGAVASIGDVLVAMDADIQIVDARSASRYKGEEVEPRPGVQSGHIPGSHNVPYRSLLTPEGRLKDPSALREIFNAAGVDPGRAMITTCGSGVSAAILALAVERLGHEVPRLYDGSWTEWGGRTDVPIARA